MHQSSDPGPAPSSDDILRPEDIDSFKSLPVIFKVNCSSEMKEVFRVLAAVSQ